MWPALAVMLTLVVPGVISHAAESTYTGGTNFRPLQKGLWGPLNFGPRAEYGSIQLRGNEEFTFDDNVYLTERARLHDWASITSPGLAYKLGSADTNFLELGYDVNIRRYFEQTRSDGEEHKPYLINTYTIGITKLTITDNLTFVKGGGLILGGNELTVRSPKTSNDGTISTETKIDDKLALGFHVHHNLYVPGAAPLLASQQIDGGFNVFYKAFAKADLFIEGNGGHIDVTRGGRQDYAQGKVGVRGDLSPKLSGRVDVGGEHRMSSIRNVSDQDNPVVGASLLYTFNDDLKSTVRGTRAVQTSISTAGQTYVNTTAGFGFDYQFGPLFANDSKVRQLALTLDYDYSGSEFNLATAGVKQSVDLHTVATSFAFRIQPYWMAYVVYRYQNNDSNLPNGDYFNNRISIGTCVLF